MLVAADPQYLLRLLTIVLENAGKYTVAGGSVRLGLQVKESQAYFQISDTGIGIPAADQKRIFERFWRGSNVREANAHGSGLGLALAAWIADRHRTAIDVYSIQGSGSSFSWSLPLEPDYNTQETTTCVGILIDNVPSISMHSSNSALSGPLHLA